MATSGKPITCKAAVCWEANKPLQIETVEVAAPKRGEVRVKVMYTGVCHSDANWIEGAVPMPKPIVLGHESSGIIESVGEGVTEFKAGDHVVPLFVPQCGNCRCCDSGKTNLCVEYRGKNHINGKLLDGTTRFTCKGQPINQLNYGGSFTQYTVVPEMSLCKIDPTAPLDKVCLLGCGIATGYGAALNTAQVEPGSTCAVWGLGTIGLAVAMGCKKAGASRIIGIDINADKLNLGKQFGLTEGVNPKELTRPLQEVLVEMTDGGLDYVFECVGNVNVMRTALESSHRFWGKTILLGISPLAHDLVSKAGYFNTGRHMLGSIYGGWKGKQDIPKLIEGFKKKEFLIDEFITHRMGLDKINEAFDLMRQGKSLRTVLHMWP